MSEPTQTGKQGPTPHRRMPWRETKPVGPTNPDPTMAPAEVFLSVGRIVGAHGVRGEAKLEITTDDPDQLLDLRRVYFDDDPTPRRLTRVRFNGRQALLTFPEITDRDGADALRGTIVRVAGSQLKPPGEDEFFHYQLIGLAVYDETGAPLGTLSEILEAGEVDTYIVRDDDGREHLFPALKDVVLDINPAENRVVVRPLVWEDEPQPRPRPPHRPDHGRRRSVKR